MSCKLCSHVLIITSCGLYTLSVCVCVIHCLCCRSVVGDVGAGELNGYVLCLPCVCATVCGLVNMPVVGCVCRRLNSHRGMLWLCHSGHEKLYLLCTRISHKLWVVVSCAREKCVVCMDCRLPVPLGVV